MSAHSITDVHFQLAADLVMRNYEMIQDNPGLCGDGDGTDNLLVAAIAYGGMFAKIVGELNMEPAGALLMLTNMAQPTDTKTMNAIN